MPAITTPNVINVPAATGGADPVLIGLRFSEADNHLALNLQNFRVMPDGSILRLGDPRRYVFAPPADPNDAEDPDVVALRALVVAGLNQIAPGTVRVAMVIPSVRGTTIEATVIVVSGSTTLLNVPAMYAEIAKQGAFAAATAPVFAAIAALIAKKGL